MARDEGSLRRELLDLAAQLAPGWAASVSLMQGRLTLELAHPLSPGARWVLLPARDVTVEVRAVREWLHNDDEIISVNQAPSDVPHVRLLRGLRQLARSFQWSSLACRSLGNLLHSEGLLTDAEAAWFRGFTGVGAPYVMLDMH